ncbi:MAG: hypothetical protein KDD82_00290 [Planctomycetes bacterium]|nr:hypothetical protein [Planctomycetota bacterium]
MDYQRFLDKREEQVLPYLGGAVVDAPGRALRVKAPVAPGWWRFELRGRDATALAPAEPSFDAALPRVRGHLLGPRLVGPDGLVAELSFLPEDEPPLFAPAAARRWHSGDLLFEQLEFETEAEEAARRALEDGRGLAGVKAVPASLRAAFAYALVERAGREHGVPASPLEVRQAVGELAKGGPARAVAELQRLQARRRTQRVLAAAAIEAGRLTAEEARVTAALAGTAARLLRLRRLAGEQLEVTYSFLGTRFQSIVDARTLNVVDAGVCLSGEDGALTLESLPGVIREAVDTEQLVITRAVSHDG